MTYPVTWLPLLAAAPRMSAGEQLQFILAGLAVVLVTLCMIALYCGVAGVLFARTEKRQAAASAAGAVSAPAGAEEIPGEVIAAITAAVAATVGEHHGIVHIRGLTPEQMSWTHEGLARHHASHNVGPR